MSKRKVKKPKSRLKPMLFGIIAVLCLAVFMVVSWISKGEDVDEETGCPKSGPNREVVVLLDISDPLSNKHKAGLGRIMRDMISPSASDLTVRKGERLTFYTLSNSDKPKKALQLCNPGGNPKEHQPRFSGCTEGKFITQKRWDRFENKILNLFPKKESGDAQPQSFILETIAVIIPEHARSRWSKESKNRLHLIVISDLLQNTEKLSHYQSSYPAPKSVGSDLSTDLSQTEVSLFQLKRQKYAKYQTPDHYNWWVNWVKAMNGELKLRGKL